ncbi:hypothetical protein LPJ56_000415 [Coemansia sp. RSA 2599]|nr:hypothetical protein LPJ75_000071 [Coemansia sp. RSA 2598]KAJ1829316.1 hypothetical protein LPJ56_000415 [Coemansia sp. RSA 2599]
MPPPVTFNIDPTSAKSGQAGHLSKEAALAKQPAIGTESSVHPNSDASEALCPPGDWQRGREERIRRLEAALETTARRRQQKHKGARTAADAEMRYGDMLDSEDEGANTSRIRDGLPKRHRSSSSSNSGAENNEDVRSETSSLFYSEGQPLLCTYYQPPPAPSAAGAVAGAFYGGYGSINAPSPPPKRPEQYLPWSARLLDALHSIGLNPRSLCSGCCRRDDNAHSAS